MSVIRDYLSTHRCLGTRDGLANFIFPYGFDLNCYYN